jgi:hypothetical protein
LAGIYQPSAAISERDSTIKGTDVFIALAIVFAAGGHVDSGMKQRLDVTIERVKSQIQRQTAVLRARVQANVIYDNCVLLNALDLAMSQPNEFAEPLAKAAEPMCSKQHTDLYLATYEQVKTFGDYDTAALMTRWEVGARERATSCIIEYRRAPESMNLPACQAE